MVRLAQACGLHALLGGLVWIGTSIGSNPAGKISAIVAGMVTGADSIEDLDVIHHGGMPARFGGCYAPSTLGSFLREFTFGHVRQLGAAARRFLVNLARNRRFCPAPSRSPIWTWWPIVLRSVLVPGSLMRRASERRGGLLR